MSTARTTIRQRVGLVITALLSISNIVSVASPTPARQVGPPLVVLVAGAALGIIGVVGSILGWRSGNRRVLRIVVGAALAMALLALPAFFVDAPAFVKAEVGIVTLVTIAAAVLVLSSSTQRTDVGYSS